MGEGGGVWNFPTLPPPPLLPQFRPHLSILEPNPIGKLQPESKS